MGLIDVFSPMFPTLAARWYYGQARLQSAKRLYDAAQSSGYRGSVINKTSPDALMSMTGDKLRQVARHLDENHDLVVGLFDDLVNNTVGSGVSVAPLVRMGNGRLAEKLNVELRERWAEWSENAEVTGQWGWNSLERQVARSLYRDGELFVQLVGAGKGYRWPTQMRFALEMLEADYCPFDYDDHGENVVHGIECDQWGRSTGYYFYRTHPGELMRAGVYRDALKRIAAESIIHLRYTRRFKQRRGVPVIHAVINRLRDVKDYEESERIAAKVAADMTGFIKRTADSSPAVMDSDTGQRNFRMQAGAIFELLPGEDVGTIGHSRPNTSLEAFRESMLRAVAAGTGTRFSSIARNYNGTYSAQRQELVEGVIAYRAHFAYLVSRFYRPVWRRFIDAAVPLLSYARGVDVATLYRADFRAPALPWIDPAKEANAWKLLVDSGLESRQEIIRQRGRDPVAVYEEIEEELSAGVWASMVDDGVATPAASGAEVADDGNDEDDN